MHFLCVVFELALLFKLNFIKIYLLAYNCKILSRNVVNIKQLILSFFHRFFKKYPELRFLFTSLHALKMSAGCMLFMCELMKINWNYYCSPDRRKFPTITLLAAGLCVSGTLVYVLNFNPAISLCTLMLRETFEVRNEDLSHLYNYRTFSFGLAIFNMALAGLVVATDVLRTDAQTSKNPICIFCYGTLPCVMVGTAINICFTRNQFFNSSVNS